MKNLFTPLAAAGLLFATAPRGLSAQEVDSAIWHALDEAQVAPPGDSLGVKGSTPQWGTSANVVRSLSAWDFSVIFSHTTTNQNHLNRYIDVAHGGFGAFVAGVALPAGALVNTVELVGCDVSTSGQLAMYFRSKSDSGQRTNLAYVTTGESQTPGCSFFQASVTPPVTVDNFEHFYEIVASNVGAIDGSVNLLGARIYYKLQVSPAPATATFSDVPRSHLFFRQVEALVASGITSGCGGNKFCPNAPLTRGQMAAFLAKALGLHWPN